MIKWCHANSWPKLRVKSVACKRQHFVISSLSLKKKKKTFPSWSPPPHAKHWQTQKFRIGRIGKRAPPGPGQKQTCTGASPLGRTARPQSQTTSMGFHSIGQCWKLNRSALFLAFLEAVGCARGCGLQSPLLERVLRQPFGKDFFAALTSMALVSLSLMHRSGWFQSERQDCCLPSEWLLVREADTFGFETCQYFTASGTDKLPDFLWEKGRRGWTFTEWK